MANRPRKTVLSRRQRVQELLDQHVVSHKALLERLAGEGEQITVRTLQRDIKSFWEKYTKERRRRDNLLYALADGRTIRSACRLAHMGYRAARIHLDDPGFRRQLAALKLAKLLDAR